jgi:hypothetical protein
MHIDESLPLSRPPMSGSGASADIKLPTPAWAKAPGMPGGVPPMFASPGERPAGAGGDEVGH